LLASGLWYLTQNQDQLNWLLADLPGRLPLAREELTRIASPVIYMRRTATRDVTIGTTHIAQGQKVVMYFGAANRDPAHFTEPHRLDLSRSPNDHLAYGTGPHACLGKHLARLEIDAGIASGPWSDGEYRNRRTAGMACLNLHLGAEIHGDPIFTRAAPDRLTGRQGSARCPLDPIINLFTKRLDTRPDTLPKGTIGPIGLPKCQLGYHIK